MPPTTAKILITTTTFPRWKNDSKPEFILTLCKALKEEGLIPIVLMPCDKGSQSEENFNGIHVYRYRYFFKSFSNLISSGGITSELKKNALNYIKVPFLFFFQFLAIQKIIKKENISIIHAHWVIPQGIIAVLYKRIYNKNIKIICTSHGSDINNFSSLFMTKLKKWSFKNIDLITAVSSDLKNAIITITNQPIVHVTPLGIDTSIFSKDAYSKTLKETLEITGNMIFFAGRLTEEKGILNFLKILPLIQKSLPSTVLVIAGSGPLMEKIKTISHDLKIERSVRLLGFIKNHQLASYFATADLVVIPSIHEGFGLTCIEAMASEALIACSDIPSLKELIIQNKTGFLFDMNKPTLTAQIICEILNNKNKYNLIRINGRKLVIEKYSYNKSAKVFHNLYESL